MNKERLGKAVYAYSDYRDALFDRFLLKKETDSKYSYQFLASRLNVERSYIPKVFQKKRHVAIGKLIPFARALGLSALERQYLVFLHLGNVANEPELTKYVGSVLKILRRQIIDGNDGKTPMRAPASDRLFLNNWLNVLIYSLVLLEDFTPDPAWMKARLGLRQLQLKDIDKAWKTLLKSNLVKEENGKFARAKAYSWSLGPFEHEKHRLLQQELASHVSLQTQGERPAEQQLWVLTLSRAEAEEIATLLRKFQREFIMGLREGEPGKDVYLLTNQLLPITP
jgi:uncharacterized protein (TIGR02147 family)